MVPNNHLSDNDMSDGDRTAQAGPRPRTDQEQRDDNRPTTHRLGDVVELDRPPSTARLYRTAALGALPAPLSTRHGAEDLPETRLVLRDTHVDQQRLAAYNRVCGFGLADTLPPSYPQVMAFPLAMALMTERDFPFPVIGLVHVANRIEVRRPIGLAEPLDLCVHAAALRPHSRGRQFDLVTDARVGTELVWRSVATYLRRERHPAPRGTTEATLPPTASDEPAGPMPDPDPVRHGRADTALFDAEPGALWRVTGRLGIDYAAVSGDHNPIHTSRLGARLFGFQRPIAHGMWSKARALAALRPRLPDSYVVDVRFKLPIPLPSTVAFAASPAWSFAVWEARSGKPHLIGTIR